MASLSPNHEATEMVLMKGWSEHVSLMNFWIFPAQLLVEDMRGVLRRVKENLSFPNLVMPQKLDG